MQGRKSMFKHGGGDNSVVKYTSRLQDVSRGAKRCALLGGSGACPPLLPPRKFFSMMQFGAYLDQILFLKNFKNHHFLYKFFENILIYFSYVG